MTPKSGNRFSEKVMLKKQKVGRRGPGRWLIRARQPPHGELDGAVRQFAPAVDRGHVGGLGKAAEHLTRLFARGLARQRKRLTPVRIAARRFQSRAIAGHSAGPS